VLFGRVSTFQLSTIWFPLLQPAARTVLSLSSSNHIFSTLYGTVQTIKDPFLLTTEPQVGMLHGVHFRYAPWFAQFPYSAKILRKKFHYAYKM